MRIARVLPGWGGWLAALATACSGQRPPPAPAPIVIASGRPEPEAQVPVESSGGELRGGLDASFGKNGVGLYERAPDEQRFSHLTPLDDGSIAAVGYAPFEGSSDMVVAHVLDNGALDAGFGEHGFLRVGDKHAFGQAITHDRQGRILAAGYFYTRGGTDSLIARLDARGRLDPSFGAGGLVVRDLGHDDQPHALFVRDDGHILLVGYYAEKENAVLGLLPNGELDPSFGNRGVTSFGANARGFATVAAIAKDGSIVTGGYLPAEKRGVVARIDPRGRLESRFGDNGVVVLDSPAMSSAWAVAFDTKGRVLLGGQSVGGSAVVVRFDRDGRVDPAWGRGGVATVDEHAEDQLYALLLDARGDVVGVGFGGLAEDAKALVVHFGPRGELDPSFGQRGLWRQSFEGGTFLFDARWDARGRLIASGDVWRGQRSRALLLRLL